MMGKIKRCLFGLGRPVSESTWDRNYSAGRWDYLKELDELARYSIITGYFQFFKQGGSMLDVGCGEGILPMKQGPHAYAYYVGIDASKAAIERALPRKDHKTFFFRADAMHYVPPEPFDAIIFNEILYYCDDPLQVLKKYAGYLTNNGIFIISMKVNKTNAFIWKRLARGYVTLDETKILNKHKLSWICKVLTLPK
jgi:SAM-dependent methyltransferase